MRTLLLLAAVAGGWSAAGPVLAQSAADLRAQEDTAWVAAHPPSKDYRAPRLKNGLPDWRGVWATIERNMFDPTAFTDPRNKGNKSAAHIREWPPYKPEWEARYERKLDENAAGKATDPTADCIPGGMPRIMNASYPIEFIIEPDRVIIIHELDHQVSNIWTDGRKHPAADEIDPSFMGHSIGHWEGDTLVTDTVGVRDDTVFDTTSAMHSDKMEVVQHIRRISDQIMEDVITVIDPVAFTKPWTVRRTWRVKPSWEIKEYVCENNRNPILADGSTGFLPPRPKSN